MQISRLYSNLPNVFLPIAFNYGANSDRLNVVLAEVRKPKSKELDSHNLGKTTLLHLIDFLLLKGMSKEHFLAKHSERFDKFVFFIEIALSSGEFATIRRSVKEPNIIAMVKLPEASSDLTESPDDAWDHTELSLEEAVTLLDAWLDLRILKPYDYRKAITYFLRSQDDWSDELQLKKFQAGRDLYWKPFVAHLFGFNERAIQAKYELDDKIQGLRQKQNEQQAEVQFKEDDLPQLLAQISVLTQQVDELEGELDAFKFDAEERKIVRNLVETVEQDIATFNQQIYDIRYDIRQIDNSLNHKDKFDLDDVSEIFAEAKLHFPDQLKRRYEDLVEFKSKVTKERNSALRSRRKALAEQLAKVETSKSELDSRREVQLRILRNTDTFDKFKGLQKELTKQRAQLVYMDEQRKKLESVAEIARQAREAERDRGRIVDEIKTMLVKNTPIYDKFKKVFNDYCQRVLNHEGLFYFQMNSNNNLEYVITLGLAGQAGKASSQGDGTSYKKMVCALFDLALLKVYEGTPFFHFVFHDGMLEALDDRKKLAFLELVREQVAGKKLQYIMTVIASDLPRNSAKKVVSFPSDEIVLRLHDDGPEGRLFRMGEF